MEAAQSHFVVTLNCGDEYDFEGYMNPDDNPFDSQWIVIQADNDEIISIRKESVAIIIETAIDNKME